MAARSTLVLAGAFVLCGAASIRRLCTFPGSRWRHSSPGRESGSSWRREGRGSSSCPAPGASSRASRMGLESGSARGACPCPAGASFIRWRIAPCRSGCTLGACPPRAALPAARPPAPRARHPAAQRPDVRCTRPRSEATTARGSWSCRGSSRSCRCDARGRTWRRRPRRRRRARLEQGSTPGRSTSRSTGCVPTAMAAPPRASTGRPWPAPARWWSTGWSPAPTRRRSWCWTGSIRPIRTRSTPRFARRPRSAFTWRRPAGARCWSRVSAVRWRSTRSSGRGPQVHAHLAVVEAGGAAPAIQRLSQAETIFWVTAAEAGPSWTQGMARHGWYLVTPFPLPGLAPAFTVAGCHGQQPAAARRARSVAAA